MQTIMIAILILVFVIILAVEYDRKYNSEPMKKEVTLNTVMEQVEYIIHKLIDFAIFQGSSYVKIHLFHGNGMYVNSLSQSDLEPMLQKYNDIITWKLQGNYLYLEWTSGEIYNNTIRNRLLMKRKIIDNIKVNLHQSRIISASKLKTQCNADEPYMYGLLIKYDDLFTIENIQEICQANGINVKSSYPAFGGEEELRIMNW